MVLGEAKMVRQGSRFAGPSSQRVLSTLRLSNFDFPSSPEELNRSGFAVVPAVLDRKPVMGLNE